MSVTPENALSPELALRASLSRVIYGSCRCGDVGYRITGSPFRVVDCQSLFVPARQFRWTRGEGQVVSYRLPGPDAFSTAYCRRCGGDLPRHSRGESVMVVPAHSLEPDPETRSQAVA
jgi:hypothetical protein